MEGRERPQFMFSRDERMGQTERYLLSCGSLFSGWAFVGRVGKWSEQYVSGLLGVGVKEGK